MVVASDQANNGGLWFKGYNLDLPGHGADKTDIPQVTFDSYVEKVKKEITKLNTSVVLVGHSLAGYIVSKVAEDMPNSIEKLVCCCHDT